MECYVCKKEIDRPISREFKSADGWEVVMLCGSCAWPPAPDVEGECVPVQDCIGVAAAFDFITDVDFGGE